MLKFRSVIAGLLVAGFGAVAAIAGQAPLLSSSSAYSEPSQILPTATAGTMTFNGLSFEVVR